jgi:Ca2+-binding RTX toxin-like protein
MIGGSGNDTYVVDNVGDVVTELTGEGTDLVQTTLSSYSLATSGGNVENLTYTGTGDFIGVGNALANVVTAGIGNDTLTGGGGNDTLNGGLGTDTAVFTGSVTTHSYSLSGASVVVNDTSAGSPDGQDTLNSIETVQFGAQTFNLIAGTASSDAALTGTTGNDLLLGFNGNDVMTGGQGNDILIGGSGRTRLYLVER